MHITKNNEKFMTIKEISTVLNCSRDAIEHIIKKLYPEKMKKGKTTYLDEIEITSIKLELEKHHNFRCTADVTTDYEMYIKMKEVIQFCDQKIEILKQELHQSHNKIKLLVHDFNKTYTTTEIAKELNLKSAQELNQILIEKKIQYKQNGTWILYQEYCEKNYVSIKEEILENGNVVYHRRWTGKGRQFILELLS